MANFSTEKKKEARSLFFLSLALTLLVVISYLLYQKLQLAKEGVVGLEQSKQEETVSQKKAQEISPGFRLYIPKLKVKVPVIPNVDGGDNSEYLTALQKGVAHYAGTGLPGENSNIFIFGHSNFFQSDPGKYKQVFAQLDRLKPGDSVKVHYKKKEYRYLVSQTRLVTPYQMEVARKTKRERLTLMTCWPPGTTEKRLVVICKKR